MLPPTSLQASKPACSRRIRFIWENQERHEFMRSMSCCHACNKKLSREAKEDMGVSHLCGVHACRWIQSTLAYLSMMEWRGAEQSRAELQRSSETEFEGWVKDQMSCMMVLLWWVMDCDGLYKKIEVEEGSERQRNLVWGSGPPPSTPCSWMRYEEIFNVCLRISLTSN